MQHITHLCHYCSRPTRELPYVDDQQIGHLPVCDKEECWDLELADVYAQRVAKKDHDR